ncbi:4-hydroxy-tetrahydrodipicolinate reductase [Thermosulfuriphilus ammonigenes]|uniref:4-hydroxy-tetrahydrodipicolinate reductase n=1 Tax=Thermosulfuriphilus ammonigenes TaxID=1936021 RepID=A0A6G7PVF3_9BACT|nr:4-hydroxy-tetrahydrodipicolinate reductase [Thermosulfuriphilus ammonigenes]MBA2848161.1 4-hydroxy-tetrahydrodipicolinate reductase [Thermosulfuriphilus ammonigenes]QIJ71664.1 4-hydroxy-tetrahydrodipicolinate reductase [Thermosulfuriphilus ammonigenes]
MVKAIVAGAAGRMGGRIIHNIVQTEGIELVGAFEHPQSPAVGKDVGEVVGLPKMGIVVEDSLEKVIEAGEVIIDFTFHEASLNHARINSKYGKAMVIGTTGFSKEELEEIHRLAQESFPLVQAYNMSTGINLLYKLVELTAQVLSEGFDIEIVEAHHRLKKDAPSGTAIALANVIAKVKGWDDSRFRFCRQGLIGERPEEEIGIQTIRGGDIVGEHTVFFAGIGERIELTHRASSRDTFARGAVRAAKWVVGQPKGVYDMHDVLGLK